MTSVYEVVRALIISSLEEGTVPWRQTWQGLTPVNLATGRPTGAYAALHEDVQQPHSLREWG